MAPLDLNRFPAIHCSPIGLVPKGSSGNWRLIVDLSLPQGHSVNNNILSDWCSLEYISSQCHPGFRAGGSGAV